MLAFHGIITCFMLLVMAYDFTRYIIPNWIVATLALLYPLMVMVAPSDIHWLYALAVAAVMFSVGVALFAFKVMGGGDIKLLTVCSLWAGVEAGAEFLLGVGLLGGAMSLALWLLRPSIAWWLSRMQNPPTIPRIFTIGEPVPYGLAIAGSFLAVLWMGLIPGLPLP